MTASWRVPSGWLVDAADPLTDAQRDAARAVAADAGLTAEIRDEQGGLGTLRQSATAAGALFALGVLAMTVGLIRSESGRDLRTLTAAGATSTTRRTLTAATAGGLALLGALLGTASAYLALGAGYSHELGELTPMPVPEVIAVLIGLPLLATASGWLLAGREPDALGRAGHRLTRDGHQGRFQGNPGDGRGPLPVRSSVHREVAQLGSARRSGRRGRGFKSRLPDH